MLEELDRDLGLRGSLADWVWLAWSQVESTPYIHGWHVEVICEHLEAMVRGEITDMVINIPPGFMKSLLCNVFLPPWVWLRDPSAKFFYGSFDQSLVGRRDGGRIISLLGSKWWADRFPKLLVQNRPSAVNFDIDGGGFRFSSSPGGRGTGRHPNFTIIDDPIKPKDTMGGSAITHKLLTRVSEWYHGTLSTRKANPSRHGTLVVMQRLHKDDLAGELVRAGAYHLNLPMRFEAQYRRPFDRRTVDGELLWPERFPKEATEKLEKELGPTHASAQLQQRPNVKGGGIFKRVWWKFWGEGNEPCLCDVCFDAEESRHDTGIPCAQLPEAGHDLQSWDLAFKGKATSDFVAGGAWRVYKDKFYLLDWKNVRASFSETKLLMMRETVDFPSTRGKILVEDAANGPAIESELKHELRGIELVTPEGGKEARAHACEPVLALGNVYLPKACYPLLTQAEAFPFDLNDDLVDMLTQAIVWYRKRGSTADWVGALKNVQKA